MGLLCTVPPTVLHPALRLQLPVLCAVFHLRLPELLVRLSGANLFVFDRTVMPERIAQRRERRLLAFRARLWFPSAKRKQSLLSPLEDALLVPLASLGLKLAGRIK